MTTKPRGQKAKSTEEFPRIYNGVLVAGMHRSGTSAMTRVLNLLGCALPDELIPPNLGNDQGHWEAFSVVALNDQILSDAGSFWNDWTALNSDWRASSLRDEAIVKASEVVRDHSKIRTLFAIKDPRISRVADIWLAAFDASGVIPTVIIMLRNPVEVAKSLEARDLMVPAYAHLLWLRHMLDVEFHSRGRKRVICLYDLLLNNWRATVEQVKLQTGLIFPRNSPSIQSKIDLFLDASNRHHNVSSDGMIDDSTLPKWVRDVYAIFLRWNKLGEQQADWTELDSIRKAFDQSSPAFFQLIMPAAQSEPAGSGARLKLQLEEQLRQVHLAKDEANRVTEESRFLLAEAESSRKVLVSQIEESKFREGQLQSKAEELRKLLHEAEQELNKERDIRTRVQQQLDQASERAILAENTLIQRKEELAQVWKELETVRGELTEERHFRQAAEAARGDATRQLTARFSEIATLTKLLREAAAETEASQAKFQWLRSVEAVSVRFPRWWYIMPAAWRRRKEHERYARHGIFDAQKYLQLYPDVAASGMDPLKHYIMHGIEEKRINPTS